MGWGGGHGLGLGLCGIICDALHSGGDWDGGVRFDGRGKRVLQGRQA